MQGRLRGMHRTVLQAMLASRIFADEERDGHSSKSCNRHAPPLPARSARFLLRSDRTVRTILLPFGLDRAWLAGIVPTLPVGRIRCVLFPEIETSRRASPPFHQRSHYVVCLDPIPIHTSHILPRQGEHQLVRHSWIIIGMKRRGFLSVWFDYAATRLCGLHSVWMGTPNIQRSRIRKVRRFIFFPVYESLFLQTCTRITRAAPQKFRPQSDVAVVGVGWRREGGQNRANNSSKRIYRDIFCHATLLSLWKKSTTHDTR